MTTRYIAAATLTAAAVVGLSACGSSSGNPVQDGTRASASTSPSTSAVLTMEQAKAKYLSITGPYNGQRQEVINLVGAGQVKAGCKMAAKTLRDVDVAYGDVKWPAVVQPLFNERLSLDARSAADFDRCAEAADENVAGKVISGLDDDVEATKRSERVDTLTNTIRTLFGLPPVTKD